MLDVSAAFITFPVLETPRLILREMTLDDTDNIFRIRSNPQVMRYFGSPPMQSRDEAVRSAEERAVSFREQTSIRWGITRRGSPRLLGTCGFWRLIREHYRAEIGYDLAEDAWGQGIMPEALGAMLGWGFATLGLHSVEAQIHPANTGSRRVLEKSGFVQEGLFRESYYENGEFTDAAVFSLLRSQFSVRP